MALTGFFMGSLLPFLLVFVLVFAILQKSNVLEGNPRIDALISLSIALILVLTPPARDFVVNLVPWLAVGAAALLVFFVLYGFVVGNIGSGSDSGGGISTGLKIAFGIMIGIFSLVGVIFSAGLEDVFFSNKIWGNSEVLTGIVMVIIVVGVFFIAINSGKSKKP